MQRGGSDHVCELQTSGDAIHKSNVLCAQFVPTASSMCESLTGTGGEVGSRPPQPCNRLLSCIRVVCLWIFSADVLVATGSVDKTIKITNLTTGAEVLHLADMFRSAILSLDFNPRIPYVVLCAVTEAMMLVMFIFCTLNGASVCCACVCMHACVCAVCVCVCVCRVWSNLFSPFSTSFSSSPALELLLSFTIITLITHITYACHCNSPSPSTSLP
jgi:hypothetical protein